MADQAHIYNLKAVVNEVGLSPATLRAWERRYGLLRPQRSAGGHRLYSRQDIDMLKWLVERQQEGLSISRAVEMWKSQQGSFPEVLRQFQAPVPAMMEGATLLDELRQSWLSACMVFDDAAANPVLDQAFAIAPPETICIEVLQKGLAEMGDRWYVGSASVQHEHFASTLATQRINALMAAVIPPSRAGRILAACPPGEEHSIALLLAAYLLRRHGWDVVFLGANIPLKDLDSTIRTISPVLILSAAQTLPNAASLRAMSETVALHGVPLAYGGGIFTQIPYATRSVAGHYLGDDMAQAPGEVERLIITPPPRVTAQAVTSEYEQVLSAFSQNETLIRAFAESALQARRLDLAYIEIADSNLPSYIISALRLGDISYLDQCMVWLNGFLKNFGLSTVEAMEIYSAYSLAIDRYLGREGALIHDRLSKQISAA